MSTATPRSHSAIGAFGQIGHSPHFYALMAFLLPASYAANAVSSVRLLLSAQAFGGTAGVGSTALAASLSGVVLGSFAGQLSDRRDPRVVLSFSYLLLAGSYVFMGIASSGGGLTRTQVILVAAIEGALFAFITPSLAKVQAACVPQDARGAAEVLNGIRGSIGGIVGVLTVGWWSSASITAIACATLAALTAAGTWFTHPPMDSQLRTTHIKKNGGLKNFYTLMKVNVYLRSVVIADLVLYLALPTTLLSLAVVDQNVLNIAPLLSASGISGVLAGRLLLARLGTFDNPRRNAVRALRLYAALAFLAFILMIDGWLLEHVTILVVIAILASGCGSFLQGMLGAKVQERTPDDKRGTLSGVMFSLRGLQISAGVAAATYVVTTESVRVYLPILGVLLLLSLWVLRGFKCLDTQNIEPANN